MFTVFEITNDNKVNLHCANQPFDVIGRLDIRFIDGEWVSNEVMFDIITRKQYPNYNGANASDYINSNDRQVYFAFNGSECVGQILLSKSWNGYAHIEDISVGEVFRCKGVGTLLLSKACDWAKENGLSALSLECQDNNVYASRFLIKNGFKIGGVNAELYAMLGEPYSNETAVFWYKTNL